MITVRVQNEMFDVGAELAALEELGGGAVASFSGIARQDGDVTAIELEHFPGMTEATLRRLAEEATKRWKLLGVAIIHRIGRIDVGEKIVLVTTVSAHRAEALEACNYLIDRLKTDAPFWKKEHRSDGGAEWVEAKESDDERAGRWNG